MNPVPIGVAFVAAVLVLLVAAFNLNRLPFTSGTTYSAAFTEAAGLRAGDKVRVAGVTVGDVRSVTLEGTHVRVQFTVSNGHVPMGSDTTASIEIFTLLGNKYLALDPKGPGRWPAGRELPLTQTTSPYDVTPAFQDLAGTVGKINTGQLADAFDTLSATFRNSPPALRSMLAGLSRLSETIASRDDQLTSLLQHANGVTGVLADRRQQFVRVLGDGDQLLKMVEARRQVISELLANTSAMSTQLVGLVHDNNKTIGPMLSHVHDVVQILDDNQNNLEQSIKELYVFVRGEVDATGAGPWFDGTAINATNPITVQGAHPPVSTTPPKTLGDLLGVPQAQAALAGRSG